MRQIKELQTKRKEVRATGDGDKKQTGETGSERQRHTKERGGAWTRCAQNGFAQEKPKQRPWNRKHKDERTRLRNTITCCNFISLNMF